MRNIHYINAGAGSGKTFTLTRTLVDLILKGKCRPSEVILTTFTELAASEFRQKAYDALVKAGRYDAVAELDSATIGTVHSVALKYVQKYWYLLGLGSRMNVLSEEDKRIFISSTVGTAIGAEERLVLKTFDDTFMKRGYKDDSKWIDVLTQILDRSQTFRVDSLEESKRHSLEFIGNFFTAEPVEIPEKMLVQVVNDYLKVCKSKPEKSTYVKAMDELEDCIPTLPSYAGLVKLGSLLKRNVGGKAVRNAIPNFEEVSDLVQRALCSSALKEPLVNCCETMFNLAIKVDKAFTEFKASRGLIEFNDMEKYFLQLLDMEVVREDIRSSVKFVFVDEFQDSNHTQIDIFDRLSELVQQSYWVGDPKQSIYGFRGSAPEVVLDVTSKIYAGGNGFTHDDLPYSWRSGENLVAFDSCIARKLFPDAGKYPQPALQHAPKGNPFNLARPVTLWCGADISDGLSLGQKIIETLRTTDLQPRDIAVLIRSNEDVIKVAAELKALGLPVSSPEVFLPQKAETQLLFALLRFIILRDDHTKAELAKLILNKSLPELIAHKDEILEAFDNLRFVDILERVKYQSVPDIVDTLIDELDLRGLCAKWGDSSNRQSNLDTLQAQAREYDNHCIQLGLGSSIGGYIDYVTGLQIPPRADNASDGVKVMTYHGAKGLEWRMVIMYSTWTDPIFPNVMAPRFLFGMPTLKVDGKTILRYVPDFRPSDKNGIPSFITDRPEIAQGIDDYKEQQREECKRLLYVGMTRAKDYLVTITYPNKQFKWLKAAGLEPGSNGPDGNNLAHVWDIDAPLVKVEYCDVDNPVLYNAEVSECTWYKPVIDSPVRETKFVTPSKQAVTVESEKGERHVVSDGIEVTGSFEATELGTCIHNYFAVHNMADEENLARAERLIDNFGFKENIPHPEQLVETASRLFRWFDVKIGHVVGVRREVPFVHRQTNGQTSIGEIDLVVELAGNHCLLVDYKNTREEGDYASQLKVYRSALQAAGYTVDKAFIFYALRGVLQEIKF